MIKYNFIARLLHWLMALMILANIAGGLYMTGLHNEDPMKYTIYDMHKSFGMVLLSLIIIRIINRLVSKAPALPMDISRFEQILAQAIHFILYIFMLLIPIAGYLMSTASGKVVKVFNFPIISLVGYNPDLAATMHFIHVNAWYLMLITMALHVIGTAKHYFYDKINLIRRM